MDGVPGGSRVPEATVRGVVWGPGADGVVSVTVVPEPAPGVEPQTEVVVLFLSCVEPSVWTGTPSRCSPRVLWLTWDSGRHGGTGR